MSIKPILRAEAHFELQQKLLSAIQQTIPRSPMQFPYQSCITCNHFTESTELCSAYGNMRPPARVIAFGCGVKYDDKDDIPF